MRRTSLIVIASCLLASFAAAQESRPAGDGMKVTVPTFANATCPAMGKPTKPDLFVETDHGRVYVCCKMCIKKVENDKDGMYKKAYPNAKPVGNKTCPSSGEALEKKAATVTIQGHEIGLCCNDCSKAVLENSQIWLAKLTNPKVTDVGNTTDPIDGKPVANNAFVLIGDDLVHLSSQENVAAVTKDPKAALAKAKEGKSGEKKKEAEKKGGPHEAGGCCAGKDSGDEGGCCATKAKALTESRPAK